MSVASSQTQTAPSPAPRNPGNAIEASCRLPLLALFASGATWFFLAILFSFLASLKFHEPHILASQAFWTYGRVHAASVNCLLYGFGVPMVVAVSYWLLCRLGRAPLACPVVALIGAKVWNLAVAAAVIGVLCGDSTGFDAFELPKYVLLPMLMGYLLMGVPAMLTFHRRAEGALYPSQWFVLGALFWFPWIFTTAAAMLVRMPARGIMQPIVAWWYAHNFSTVFLGFAGLASILYFVPKLLGRPLHSAYLAMAAFWGLAFFGSCGGIPAGAPFPIWIVSLSTVGTILSTAVVIAVAVNFYQTIRNDLDAMDNNLPVRFAYVALVFWLIASVHQIVGVLPNVAALTNFTWFAVAQWKLFHYGFFALAVFGAIYYVTPRLLDAAAPPDWSVGLVKAHFWCMFFGILISYISLIVGGVGQGFLLNDTKYTITQVMAGTLTALRADTMGDLLILLGTFFFLLNLAKLLVAHCRACCALFADAKAVGKDQR
jgi:cytochrome c oxidase cbb3-type subunit 1